MPLTRRNRRRKQNNKEDINVGSKSLNDLADNVLSNILSFLPTKEAVRTSILSKRWEFIWTTIPKLSFDQGATKTTDFMKFIERALSLRGSSKITNFSLTGKMDTSRSVQAAISAVAQCNVEDFELHLDHIKEALSLPLNLLNSATLTHLRVGMKGQKLTLPFLINLPSLKQIKLWNITFPSQHSAQNLFYGCPVLEDLQLSDCTWLNIKTVSVSSSKLQNLSMNEALVGLQNGQNIPKFVIEGSDLRRFNHFGLLCFDYCIMNPALLEEVTINTDSSHQNPMLLANYLLKLLKNVSHVPKLMLARSTISLLLGIPEAVNVPMFLGVKSLELDYKSSDFSNVRLLKILENTPCLQALLFYEGIMVPSNPIEDGILDPVPSCFLNQLNSVFVHVMYGDDVDLVGIKLLLKNAKVLRKMDILLGLFVTQEKRNKFPIELLKLTRASKDCGIFIV